MWAQNNGTGQALYAYSAGGIGVQAVSNASYGVYSSTSVVWAGVAGVSTNANGMGVAGANGNLLL
ncbi:MAG: hypothetical protein NZ933_03995, partial [Bacteroidia bacterium]|nr:hypothetical protein [Bacteroidia bacterium]